MNPKLGLRLKLGFTRTTTQDAPLIMNEGSVYTKFGLLVEIKVGNIFSVHMHGFRVQGGVLDALHVSESTHSTHGHLALGQPGRYESCACKGVLDTFRAMHVPNFVK
jgi:hypothetical protein